MATALAIPRPFLTDRIARSWAGTAALVIGFAGLTALCAQVSYQPSWAKVPFTLQTFAVLLAGGSLGAVRGAASQFMYVLAGLVGVPVFADGESGWAQLTGRTGGYLIGFIVAAYLVGFLAERRWDRSPLKAWPAFLLGSAVIYAIGVPWLKIVGDLSWADAAYWGMVVFLITDLVKALLSGVLLPSGWWVRDRLES